MSSRDPLNLDSQLCFALYSTSLAMTQAYKKLLEPYKLTYPQFTILLILWEQDGISLQQISNRLGQQSGALTPVLKRMESLGLIRRIRGKHDERTLSIELTKNGRQLQQVGLDIHQCVLESSGLATKTIKKLIKELDILRNNLLQ